MLLRLTALLLLLPALTGAAVIEGRVVQDDRPLAGMRVSAHREVDSRTPAVASTTSDADGRYRLTLPDGRYALFAVSSDGQRFAASGRNPLEVAGPAPQWLGLQAVPVVAAQRAPYDDSYSAAIEGRVLLNGRPLAGAVVGLYLDSSDLKGPGYRLSLPTGADGAFVFDNLPEADYFVVARRRDGGQRVGPVLEGDDFAWFPANPLRVQTGKVSRIELHAVRKVREEETSAAAPQAPGLQLSGVVVDRAGQPVAGMHIFAYTDKVIGHKRPAAVSAPTASDGRFVVVLPQAGSYYLGARQYYGDSPAPGELFGLYDGSADHGLQVEPTRTPPQLRIVVEPITLN